MLKIKDDVDLKELEKFGFKQEVYIDKCYVKTFKLGTAYREEIIIWKRERKLILFSLYLRN